MFERMREHRDGGDLVVRPPSLSLQSHDLSGLMSPVVGNQIETIRNFVVMECPTAEVDGSFSYAVEGPQSRSDTQAAVSLQFPALGSNQGLRWRGRPYPPDFSRMACFDGRF